MQFVDKAVCLCLDKRREEWEDLQNHCESKGLKFDRFLVGEGDIFSESEYNHVDIKDVPPHWGYGNPTGRIHHFNAFLSHKKMILKSKEEGLNNVLFLEDDAYFTNRYDEVVESLSSELNSLDFDFLFLGWWIGYESDDYNQNVEKEYNSNKRTGIERVRNAHFTCGGLHGVVINQRMFDPLLQLHPIGPIDSQLNRFFHPFVNSYYVFPKIIHDKGIFSHCEQSVTPRLKL